MLVAKTNQMIEEVNEIKDLCMRQIASEIEYMEDEVFVLYQKMIKLINTSMEVMKEQAEVIESMNEKLDKLLVGKE